MPRFCANCGAQMEDNAGFCPACGKAAVQGTTGGVAAAPAPAATTSAMADNVAGMLAYVTVIPAIIFLVMEPYNKRPFVRYHSFHSIFFAVAWIALWIVLSIVGMVPFLGVVTLFVFPVVALLGLIVWVVLLLKAYQGQVFKLPVIGDMAEKQANAM
ncbi:MAG TPA: zinc-ribbon domain-containing protein [Terriglobales bacterium]|nr:zinc-ribbon domain-containing protein [Terriglobales bacterium]